MNEIATITDLTADEARDLTGRIRQTGAVLWAQIEKAYHGRAWLALGYESWDAYCDAEFDGARLKLPREERREVVASLRDAGMSTRAIASATGVSKSTVADDLTTTCPESDTSRSSPPPADDEYVEQLVDGLAQAIDSGEVSAGQVMDVLNDEIVEDDEPAPPPEPKPVAGLDGKTYTSTPKPAKPRRGPLTNTANNAGWKLEKAVGSIRNVVNDDRFDANRETIIRQLRGHVDAAVKELDGLQAEFECIGDDDSERRRLNLAVRRMEWFAVGYQEFHRFTSNPNREEILRRLSDHAVNMIERAERNFGGEQ